MQTGKKDGKTDRQRDRRTDRQTDRQTDRRTDRERERERERERRETVARQIRVWSEWITKNIENKSRENRKKGKKISCTNIYTYSLLISIHTYI